MKSRTHLPFTTLTLLDFSNVLQGQFFICVPGINLLKKANGEIFKSASVDKCHQKATFVQKCSENKCLKGWNTLKNQKGKIPKINQN